MRSPAPWPRIVPAMLRPRPMFPELERARRRPERLRRSRQGRGLLGALEPILAALRPMPETPYSLYRQYQRSGDRGRFEIPYFARRRNLVAAVAAEFLAPGAGTLDAVQDYLWAICEETTWILPAHERGGVDLFATETAFSLAETVGLLGDRLAAEVRQRVRHEVRERVTDRFLAAAGRCRPRWVDCEPNLTEVMLGRQPDGLWWWKGHNNWNGVCNGSTGAALLYCETDPRRLARGLNRVLEGLDAFLDTAFCADGASSEGVSYWQYGLINFVAFAELLRCRTGGKLDLLADPRLARIARFPLAVRLSANRYYNHADCPTSFALQPGVTARLAERTGTPELLGLVSERPAPGARVPMLLRDLLWWDGRRAAPPPIDDRLLSAAGIFRLRSGRLVLAGKAGHNGESHNHNDVGSFVLHSRGEDLLCDPGAPPYTREFFGPRRYELFLQTQSRGHSLPVVGGKLQGFGREFRGRLTRFDAAGTRKSVELEFARAYPVKRLRSLARRLELSPGGRFRLEDRFEFAGRGLPVEEAFVTWLPVRSRGANAVVRGERSVLTLRIAAPAGARWRLEEFQLAAKAGGRATRPGTLRRLVVRLPAGGSGGFTLEGAVKHRR